VQDRLSETQCQRLTETPIPKVYQFVTDSIELCNPDSAFVITDSVQDIKYVRDMAVKTGEEQPLAKYEDLVPLLRKVLDKEYTEEDYIRQFTIRVPENLSKIDRVEKYHRENVPGSPPVVSEVLDKQRKRLEQLRQRKGEYVSPVYL
jgi:GTP-dependent phosphoenolpyruvate carboxykinase